MAEPQPPNESGANPPGSSGQPPESVGKFPHPPDQPQRHKDPRGIDIINTMHPNESFLPPRKAPNMEVDVEEGVDADGNTKELSITGGRSTVTGKDIPMRLEPHIPQSELMRPPTIGDLGIEGVDATLRLEDAAHALREELVSLGIEQEEANEVFAGGETMETIRSAARYYQENFPNDPQAFHRAFNARLQEIRNQRANQEQEDQNESEIVSPAQQEAGETGGGDSGGGRGPEGPKGPELEPTPWDRNRLEFEATPERGREIADEIIYWESLRKDGRYNEVDWQRLDQLYTEQIVHIEALKRVSLTFNPYEGEESTAFSVQAPELVEVAKFNGFRPFKEWFDEYRRGTISDIPRFVREINVYFEQAKRAGLLQDLDAVLASSYQGEVISGIKRNLNSTDILPAVNQKIRFSMESLMDFYKDRQWTDPEIARFVAEIDPQSGRLIGAWDLYADLARGRFTTAINNRDVDGLTQRPYQIDNEFHLPQEGTDAGAKEKFWHLEHGYYVYVDAQTPEEYQIAAESYIARLESITTSPNELLQESKYFVQAIMRSENFDKVSAENPGFIIELVNQIEGRIGVFGADTSNELYKPEEYKQYMDYINKDGKGPDRWLAITRLLDGKVAAMLWALDKDPRWEILFSLFGSRGQLAQASEVQRNARGTEGLFAQVRDALIDEMMGVRIKDKRNVASVTDWMSDRQFSSLFDGLYRYGKIPNGRFSGDANIRTYEQFKNTDDKNLTPDQRRAKRLGRIQTEISDIRERIRNGQTVTKKTGGKYDPRRDSIYDLLDAKDAAFYKEIKEETSKAFDIAFQIYGALGEKSKRAGGVFKINRVKNGEEFQDFIPVHYAEKFVQFAETLAKIKYADEPAKDRVARVSKVRERAITELKKDGFEAKLYDDEGQPLILKRPKEDPNAADELARDANGKVRTEEVQGNFHIATNHVFGDWTSHTYWSYQEEDRHLVLSDESFAEARKIRDGQLRPEDAQPWAIQLLILDPTLNRVRRFTKKNFEERERKLTMAAVEDSYQSHWRIGRDLHEAFFPKFGTPTGEIGMYYGLQDYGGFRKIIENIRTRFGEDPQRYARRGMRLIPYLHVPAASLAEIWGQGSVGVLGAIRMLGAPIYRMGGTLALDKFSAQSEMANKMHTALTVAEKDQDGNLIEPLLLKLTNESDELQEIMNALPTDPSRWLPPEQYKVRAAIRKSFGRLERYEKLFVAMETSIRNASGALWIEEEDVLTDNGELNRELEREFSGLPDLTEDAVTRDDLLRSINQANAVRAESEEEFNEKFNTGDDKIPGIDEGSISMYTGSGRHSARIFHENFFRIFMDLGKRGGYESYPNERYIYEHLNDHVVYFDPNVKGAHPNVGTSTSTIKDWLFEKFVPT